MREISKRQVVRIVTKDSVMEKCGFVKNCSDDEIELTLLTGSSRGETKNIWLRHITSVTEIFSCPLFSRLSKTVSGSKDGGKDIQWRKDGKSEDAQVGGRPKPKMLLRVPADETYKRV